MKKTLEEYTHDVLDTYFKMRNTPGRKKTHKDWDMACAMIQENAREVYPELIEFKSAVSLERKRQKRQAEKKPELRHKTSAIPVSVPKFVQLNLFDTHHNS